MSAAFSCYLSVCLSVGLSPILSVCLSDCVHHSVRVCVCAGVLQWALWLANTDTVDRTSGSSTSILHLTVTVTVTKAVTVLWMCFISSTVFGDSDSESEPPWLTVTVTVSSVTPGPSLPLSPRQTCFPCYKPSFFLQWQPSTSPRWRHYSNYGNHVYSSKLLNISDVYHQIKSFKFKLKSRNHYMTPLWLPLPENKPFVWFRTNNPNHHDTSNTRS